MTSAITWLSAVEGPYRGGAGVYDGVEGGNQRDDFEQEEDQQQAVGDGEKV